jgi:hypothetical protein
MNTAPNRRAGAAAVCAVAVIAGTIASSNGNARVAPIPRNTVRRGSERRVTKDIGDLVDRSL